MKRNDIAIEIINVTMTMTRKYFVKNRNGRIVRDKQGFRQKQKWSHCS
jgi:hypothetical protein